MPSAAELKLLITGQAQTTAAVNQVAAEVRGLQTTVNGAASAMAAAALRAAALAGGIYALKGALDGSVKAASDLSETQNKVNVVFGRAAGAVNDFAENSAAALGMSKQEALDAASGYGVLFNTMGLGKQPAAEMSTQLVQLASDLASFNNIDPTEALQKLKSGLVGEAEPLRSVGVLLNEATVKAEAYRSGIAKQGAELTEGQKVQARYNLILQQTQQQQGDFARTSDGLANQQRTLGANVKEVAAAFGSVLLPMVKSAVSWINQQDFKGFIKGIREIPVVWITATTDIKVAALDMVVWIEERGIELSAFMNNIFADIADGAAKAMAGPTGKTAALGSGVGGNYQAPSRFGGDKLPPEFDLDPNVGRPGSPDARSPSQREADARKASSRAASDSLRTSLIGEKDAAIAAARASQQAGAGADDMADSFTSAAGAAGKAKTALEELNMSADTVRTAMDLLGFSADTQRAVLEALGVAAIDAGPEIEGLAVTVERLAAAFDRAGLNGMAVAQQVAAIVAEKKAAEEAKRAQEEATRAAKEHKDALKALADTIMGALKPALDSLFATGRGVGTATALAAALGINAGGALAMGQPGATGAAGAAAVAAGNYYGSGVALPGSGPPAPGVASAVGDILAQAAANYAGATPRGDITGPEGFTASLNAAAALVKAGRDAKPAIDDARKAWEEYGKFLGENLTGAELAQAGALMQAKEELLRQAEAAGDDAEALKLVADAAAMLDDQLKKLGQSASEMKQLRAEATALGEALGAEGTTAARNQIDRFKKDHADLADAEKARSAEYLERMRMESAEGQRLARAAVVAEQQKQDGINAAHDRAAAARIEAIKRRQRTEAINGYDQAALANPFLAGAVQYDQNGNPMGLTNELLERLINAVKDQRRNAFIANIDGQDVSRRSGVYTGRNSTTGSQMGAINFAL